MTARSSAVPITTDYHTTRMFSLRSLSAFVI